MPMIKMVHTMLVMMVKSTTPRYDSTIPAMNREMKLPKLMITTFLSYRESSVFAMQYEDARSRRQMMHSTHVEESQPENKSRGTCTRIGRA